MQPLFYHGSTTAGIHSIIAKHSKDGICLNLKDGFDKMAEKFAYAESLNAPLMIDNGSIERYWAFNDGLISKEDYRSLSKGRAFFNFITGEYLKLFKASSNPANLLAVIPEVVGEGPLTVELQKEFLPKYLDMQAKHGFQIIVALQFDPRSFTWVEQMLESAAFISKTMPRNNLRLRIGFPFGKDSKRIQNKRNYAHIQQLFTVGRLQGFKAHMFALGSPIKHFQFGKNRPWIMSCDASTVFRMSNYASYISREGYMLDKRDLKGEAHRKASKIRDSRAIIAREGYTWQQWTDNKQFHLNDRYLVNLENYDHVLEQIYAGHMKPGLLGDEVGD